LSRVGRITELQKRSAGWVKPGCEATVDNLRLLEG
jgi:hypothetical protein